MKVVILLSVVAMVVAEEKYTTKNDSLDIEAVITNPATLKSFYGCFVGQSPCDAVQTDLKKGLPEAIQQACSKCTKAEKHLLKRFLEGLKEKQPQKYEAFKKTFDPEGKYFPTLDKAIANA